MSAILLPGLTTGVQRQALCRGHNPRRQRRKSLASISPTSHTSVADSRQRIEIRHMPGTPELYRREKKHTMCSMESMYCRTRHLSTHGHILYSDASPRVLPFPHSARQECWYTPRLMRDTASHASTHV